MAKTTRTIYKVEEKKRGWSPPASPFAERGVPASERGGLTSASSPGEPLTRRKVFWVMVAVAVLIIVMLVAIVVLATAEDPTVGATIHLGARSTMVGAIVG